MDPRVWGPHFWFVLHLISFNYPDNPSTFDKEQHKAFYHSVKDILPCANCRQHYKNYLSQYPIEPNLDRRMDLITWVIQIHNFVNVALGKQPMSVEQVLDIYANLDPVSPFAKVDLKQIEEEKQRKYYSRLWVFIIIALLFVIAVIYVKRKYYFYICS